MGVVWGSWLLLVWWSSSSFAAGEVGPVQPTPSVIHRPGAVFVKGAKVSMTRLEYRLLIDLPTYDYDMEYSALKDFQATTNKSQAVLDTVVQ